MRNSMSEHAGRIKAFVSIHTYGGIWMTPYGYSPELPPEYEEMVCIFTIMSLIKMVKSFFTVSRHENRR